MGLIKQRGITKLTLDKKRIFNEYNICFFRDHDCGIVLNKNNLYNDYDSDVILFSGGSPTQLFSGGVWFVDLYDDDLKHVSNRNGNIQEVWEPNKWALSKIKQLLSDYSNDLIDVMGLNKDIEVFIKDHGKLIWKR